MTLKYKLEFALIEADEISTSASDLADYLDARENIYVWMYIIVIIGAIFTMVLFLGWHLICGGTLIA